MQIYQVYDAQFRVVGRVSAASEQRAMEMAKHFFPGVFAPMVEPLSMRAPNPLIQYHSPYDSDANDWRKYQ